jgi:tetratricopeptide (TPR) repeat protein
MNRRAKTFLPAFFAFAMGIVASRAGHAESRAKQSAEAHYNKGMTAYTLGRFPEAIEEFEKAYELRSEPIFLYNIAQSHRQNNNPQRAIFFYRRYIEAEPNAKNRPEIEKRIKDLESQLNAQKEQASAAPPSATAPAAATTTTPPPPAPIPVAPVEVVQSQPAAAQPQAGRGLRIAGLVTAGVGVVGIGTGILFGVHATSLHDDSMPPGGTFDSSKYDSSKTYRTLEWVSIGVGAAAIGTGAVLYVLGHRAKSAEPQLTLAPLLAPGTGGAAVLGTF